MNSVADAIVYAVAYICCREGSEESEEADNEAIQHILAYLSKATTEEEDALAAAAERALKEELSLHFPNEEMISVFENWMRIVLGADWEGNRRV